MQPKGPIATFVEPVNRPLVRSDDPMNRSVQAICHHSDEYLSREQVSPSTVEEWGGLFAQHDFPGAPGLDDYFRTAAHHPEKEHLRLMVVALGAWFCFLLAAIATVVLWASYSALEPLQFQLIPILSLVVMAGGLFAGATLFTKRHTIYHWLVQRRVLHDTLAIDDFPLVCNYDIVASEEVQADMDHQSSAPPNPSNARGSVHAYLYPEQESQKHWREYARNWVQSGFSGKTYAGLVALQQTADVDFSPSSFVDRRHRLILSALMPHTFRMGTYSAKAHGALLDFAADYTIKPVALYTEKEPLTRRFPLECIPYLDPHDSFSLKLQFRWMGSNEGQCWLDECRLTIPPELGVTHVERGYYDPNTKEAVWKGIVFAAENKQQSLTLTIGCKRPILSYPSSAASQQAAAPGPLQGQYACTIRNSTLSKLIISPEHVWNARGLKAVAERTPFIQHKTIIEGNLVVDTTRLMQEHEHISFTSLTCHKKDKTAAEVAAKIIAVLRDSQLDLLRVAQPAPRLDPAGMLDTELHYWDILARTYQKALMVPIDIHIVIKSKQRDPFPLAANRLPTEYAANVDIRIRGLHDPRNMNLPAYINGPLQQIANDIDRAIN